MKKILVLFLMSTLRADYNPREMVKTLVREETKPAITQALALEEAKVKELILNVTINNSSASSSESKSIAQALSYTQQWQMIQETASAKCLTLMAYARAHSKQLITLGLAASYCTIMGTLLKAKYFLAVPTTWANWRRHKTLKDLLEQPFEITTDELLTEIHKRYINPKNPTDAITSLVRFMNDIAYEKRQLIFYSRLTSFLAKAPFLHKVFPMIRSISRETKTQQERLAYIHNLFTSWAVEQKLSLTTRQSSHKIKRSIPLSGEDISVEEFLYDLFQKRKKLSTQKKYLTYMATIRVDRLVPTTAVLLQMKIEEENNITEINNIILEKMKNAWSSNANLIG